MSRLKIHHISFQHAFDGLRWAISTQPNFQVHFTLGSLVLLLGLMLGISYVEMILLVFTIVFVLGIEMVNTAIEAMTDLITQEWRKEAKIAKDASAGMMLIAACGSILVGAFIFLPHLITIITKLLI